MFTRFYRTETGLPELGHTPRTSLRSLHRRCDANSLIAVDRVFCMESRDIGLRHSSSPLFTMVNKVPY